MRLATEPTILLWQVLGELTQQLRRWRDQGRLTPGECSQHVRAFRYLFPLMLPTCQAAGATRLYTEDMGAPRGIDGVELINPFA